jgi:hypothetical protein
MQMSALPDVILLIELIFFSLGNGSINEKRELLNEQTLFE